MRGTQRHWRTPRSGSSYAAVANGLLPVGCSHGPPSQGSAAASPPRPSLDGGGTMTDAEDEGVSSSSGGTAPLLHSHAASTSEDDELVRSSAAVPRHGGKGALASATAHITLALEQGWG